MENIDNIKLYLPNWLEEFELVNFFEKHYRYIMLYGGRGSGKTYLIALYLILQAISKEKQRILCTRQFQASLKKSVGACLIMIIHSLGLRKHFKITNNEFVYKPNGSEFLFKGFDRNKDTIKGYQGLTHVWIEEADSLTQESWDLLKPTVFRSSNSESKLFSKECLIFFPCNKNFLQKNTHQLKVQPLIYQFPPILFCGSLPEKEKQLSFFPK